MEPNENQENALIVLRFSDDIRLRTQQSVPSSTSPVSSGGSSSHKAPVVRRRSWGVRLLLFGTSVGLIVVMALGFLLEQDYQTRLLHEQQMSVFERGLQDLQQGLQQAQTPHSFLSLPRYLQRLDQVLQKLQTHQKQFCGKSEAPAPPRMEWTWPRDREAWIKWIQTLRQELWQRLSPWYLNTRRQWTHTPALQGNRLHKRLCKTVPDTLVSQLQARLSKHSQRLLTEAQRHLEWYGWCQAEWAARLAQSRHHVWLKKMQDHPCLRSCQDRSSDRCQSCLSLWRSNLEIPQNTFQQYASLIQEAHRKRCIYWSRKHKQDAHDGVYHWGEYFWRVHRVLTYNTWLQQRGLCQQLCQEQQKAWGFQLRLESDNPKAAVYVRLWPESDKAPTSWLRQLPETVLGYTNKEILWIPALRTDFLPASVAANFWMLLLITHHPTGQSAILPLAPEPGGQLETSLKLFDLKVYNGQRFPVRFPTFSPQEDWLAFVTYPQTTGSEAFSFSEPYCWEPSQSPQHSPGQSSSLWRSTISVYGISEQGQPAAQGHVLSTQALVSQLQFSSQPAGDLELWISSDLSPQAVRVYSSSGSGASDPAPDSSQGTDRFAQPPSSRLTQGSSLWRVHVSPEKDATFAEPVQVSQALERSVDLPFAKRGSQLSVLRMQCPLPTSLYLLQKDTLTPDILPLPQGFRILHGISSAEDVAFLLQSQDENYPSLWRLRRSTEGIVETTSSREAERLRAAFRQLNRYREWLILAGGQIQDPVLAMSQNKTTTLLPGQSYVRYFDPVIHGKSRRLFVVQHWSIPGSSRWKPTTTFLSSFPLPAGFLRNRGSLP